MPDQYYNTGNGTGEEDNDPLSVSNAPGIALIVQMRIVDLLAAVLQELNPQAAKEILELHSSGALAYASPSFNGAFLTDMLNAVEDSEDPA